MTDKLDLAKLKAVAKYLGHRTFGGNVRFSDPTRQHPVGQCQQCTVLRLIERVERLECILAERPMPLSPREQWQQGAYGDSYEDARELSADNYREWNKAARAALEGE